MEYDDLVANSNTLIGSTQSSNDHETKTLKPEDWATPANNQIKSDDVNSGIKESVSWGDAVDEKNLKNIRESDRKIEVKLL